MNLIILGCGRVGSTLARMMSEAGHNVAIIDRNSDAFRRLGSGFKGERVLGNGVDEEVLKKAGIEAADAFVSLTNGDNTNIMSLQIVKEKFHVPRAIARIYDPIRACEYQEMGLQTICTSVIGARLFMDRLLGKELGSGEDYCRLVDGETLV